MLSSKLVFTCPVILTFCTVRVKSTLPSRQEDDTSLRSTLIPPSILSLDFSIMVLSLCLPLYL